MNAVERLEAAIVKLVELRDSALPAPWWLYCEDHAGPSVLSGPRMGGRIVVQEWMVDLADAELIVTLHRTIDAQLAILRNALRIIQDGSNPSYTVMYALVPLELTLADSILGVQQ